MSTALFIHRDSSFISRIQSEAKAFAQENPLQDRTDLLISPNLVHGLRVLSNPEVALSGIFFDPTDISYSALKFIELAALQRPATPLFILHPDSAPTQASTEQLLKTTHLKAVFQQQDSWKDMARHLNLNPLGLLKDLKRESYSRNEHPNFLGVPVIDFLHEKNYRFDTFIEDQNKKLVLFAVAGTPVDRDYLVHATSVSNWLFIQEEDIKRVRASLQDARERILEIDSIPSLWKTAEVLHKSKGTLQEMRQAGVSDNLIEQTLFLLGDLFQMVSIMSLEKENRNLAYFVEQAKSCDQTVASATLSLLMCKVLKFERNSILEILGLASFLQDISLYNSPHGDLSKQKPQEMSGEAYAYYLQHPLISADLVAQNTSIPDVALQVIRQQHERKDKSGFPNRIGGIQLHPMAELLSLINSYLTLSENTTLGINLATYQRLEREVFPHYSDKPVSALKSILEGFLRNSSQLKNTA